MGGVPARGGLQVLDGFLALFVEIVEVGLGFGDAVVIVAGGDGTDEVDPV